jgi:hypothetical protein
MDGKGLNITDKEKICFNILEDCAAFSFRMTNYVEAYTEVTGRKKYRLQDLTLTQQRL